MDQSAIRDLLRQLSSTDIDLDDHTQLVLRKMCHLLEKMTADRCRRIVRLAKDKPCLQVYMSDGWSTDLRTTFHSKSEGVHVQRTGRLRSEFVVQRTLIKALIGGEFHLGIKLERPRLLNSKKCSDIWSAACEHLPMLKLSGHTGVSISFYLQDGLFAKPFGQRMRARHAVFFMSEHCPLEFQSEVDKELAELRDWVISWCCAAHSCSRSLKWGMKALVSRADLVDDIHITVSSLLRASTGLLCAVAEFIAGFVVFDRPDSDNDEELEGMWAFLDVKPADLNLFVKVDPHWDGRRLHVRRSLLEDRNAIDSVSTLIKYCLSWVDFSDTRWCKVGECGRLFVRSLMIGVIKS